MITHEELMHRFAYSKETGLFTRIKRGKLRQKIGVIVGALSSQGYVVISIDGKSYLAHRLAWFFMHGRWPKFEIDHINRDRKDNRAKNLRDVEGWKNAQNRKVRESSSSGVRGVQKTPNGRWAARIEVRYGRHLLGTFDSLQEAQAAAEEKLAVLLKSY